jgi:protein involved in polysaccharide export with SLBB domain
VHYRTQHIYVLGAVRSPGVYPLRPKATLLDTISQAGGPTPEAGYARREVDKPAREFRVQLHDVLQSGDVVVIPESVF